MELAFPSFYITVIPDNLKFLIVWKLVHDFDFDDPNEGKVIVHYATSAMKRFLTSVSLQHEPKASDVITLVKKTVFARVSYEILYHEVWNKNFFRPAL